ncbi:MAG TPA: serine--tRNA ligase [Planctomycetota bacterium]|nr:serine--tRNA ligase [Planctomycetota bacterium]
MLDPKFVAANRDLVAKAIRDKNEKRADVDRVNAVYERRKKAQFDLDDLNRQSNELSKKISKSPKDQIAPIVAESRALKDRIKGGEDGMRAIDAELNEAMSWLPNVPAPEVPVAPDASGNRVVRIVGEERRFEFKPLDHMEIAGKPGWVDQERSGKISGSHFLLFRGVGARLERALINFMLDLHSKQHGYEETWTPALVNRAAMFGTGQLPKLEADMYRLEQDDLFLIPTAEVPVTNMHAGEILPGERIPAKFCAYTPCFRREAGAYGADTKGMIRVHQFDKVELVWYAHPDRSFESLETLLSNAEEVLKRLQIRYRVVLLSTGDMSFASAKTYDLEAWAPGLNRWLEVSSCSNFTDFQARRANIRFRDAADGKVKFVHTLNGSGLALPRTFITLLEQHQQADGGVRVPEALRPYLDGKEVLK